MSFGWTFVGTIGQLMLAYLLFMLVVFSACGLAGGARLGRFSTAMLDKSMYLLPMLCPLSAGIVIYLHCTGGAAASYAWYAMPLGGAVLYLVYFTALARGGRDRRGQASD